jgi:curved DNA-binding protein
MAKKDYYEVLGVSRSATAEQIKSAYRKLARKYHPDVNKASDSALRFREATEAYETLSDPQKRKMYDQFGHAGGPGFNGGPAGSGGPRAYTYGPGQGGGGFDFEDIFGAGAGGARGGSGGFMGMGLEEILDSLRGVGRRGGRATERQPQRGMDLEHHLTLDFMQAVHGTVIDLRLQRADATETISVKIPTGVNDGSRVRVRGKGGDGGDLYIVVHVSPHPYFRREGNDIYVELPVSIVEAALGAKVDVPTLEDMTTMTIPPGTSSARKLRLRGKGIASPAGQRGDQYVTIRIVPPPSLSDASKRALNEFAAQERFDPRADAPWK